MLSKYPFAKSAEGYFHSMFFRGAKYETVSAAKIKVLKKVVSIWLPIKKEGEATFLYS